MKKNSNKLMMVNKIQKSQMKKYSNKVIVNNIQKRYIIIRK